MPFFSIIIPTYNRAASVTKAIDSVLAQSFKDFELIVVDDGSTDNTRTVITAYSIAANFRYLHEPNKGVCVARNLGAERSTGDYLVFLDSDDLVETRWLQDFHDALQSAASDIAFCMMKVMYPSGKQKIVSPRQSREKEENYGIFIPGAFALKRTLFFDAGMYDESLHYGENTELSYRLKERNIKLSFIDEPNLIYHPSPDGESKNLKNRIESNKYILQKHTAFFKDHPLTKQQFLQTTGVALARLGQLKEARYYLWEGFLAYPVKPRPLLRVFVSLVPFAAKKAWRR